MKSPNAKVPHHNLSHEPIHLTYRLAGSIPKATLQELKRDREQRIFELDQAFRQTPELIHSSLYAQEHFKINARFELEIDEALHRRKVGPFHLKDPRVAKLVIDSWLYLQKEGKIHLYAVCVMGNHVHVILREGDESTSVNLSKIVNRHKSFTAIKANKLLGLTGKSFWEHFYFDRTIRKGKFTRTMWYVLNNPVEAGLVSDWRVWEWTYLNPIYDSLFR